MITVNENTARLDTNKISSNKDKDAWNRVNQESLSGKAEGMETTTPPFSFQSISNPKVKVTLEFADPDISIKSEKELDAILKDLYIKKIKDRAMQNGNSLIGCPPLNN